MAFNKYATMKRLYLLLLIIVLSAGSTRAQSFSEWFKQKKTQKKYLLAQIAALETYLKAVEKGYDIAQNGLSAISVLKDGDFMQHVLHFQRLEMVSPRVKSYSKVLAIAEMEDRSQRIRSVLMAEKDLNDLLNTSELTSLHEICDDAGSEGKKDLQELELLVTDGKLKMTDDERILRIDRLYLEVREKLRGVLLLAQNVQSVLVGRTKQRKDLRSLELLYGK